MNLFVPLALVFLCALQLRASEPATFAVGGLSFTRPEDWEWVEVTSPMRKAQLRIHGATPAEAADLTFFHFGAGAGGDAAANAQRWVNQFAGKPEAQKIEPVVIEGTKVTLVTAEGAFSNTMPGAPPATPREDQALLGAILETAEGNVFVKMTGPADLVKTSREKFLDFLKAAVSSKK